GKVLAQQLTVRRVGLGECRQPQRQCMAYMFFNILPVQLVTAFFTAPSATGNQRGDLAVGGLVRCQQDQVQWWLVNAVQKEAAADNQLQATFARCLVGAENAGEGTFVGHRQGLVAECLRLQYQLLRLAGAGQEGERRSAVQ